MTLKLILELPAIAVEVTLQQLIDLERILPVVMDRKAVVHGSAPSKRLKLDDFRVIDDSSPGGARKAELPEPTGPGDRIARAEGEPPSALNVPPGIAAAADKLEHVDGRHIPRRCPKCGRVFKWAPALASHQRHAHA